MKADGVDFNAVLMTNYYSPQTESNNNYGIEQAYVEMKGVDIAPGALFWMGKRRDRDDVHIVDTFFTNMSGVGAGVENIDAGFGKFGFSGYKTDTAPCATTTGAWQRRGPNGIARLHAQLYDIAVNPDGKLRLVGHLLEGRLARWPEGQGRLRLHGRARAGQVLRRRQPHLGPVRARLDQHQPGLRQRGGRLRHQDLAHRRKPVVADRLVRRPGHRAVPARQARQPRAGTPTRWAAAARSASPRT